MIYKAGARIASLLPVKINISGSDSKMIDGLRFAAIPLHLQGYHISLTLALLPKRIPGVYSIYK
jgi:hypothetical protein